MSYLYNMGSILLKILYCCQITSCLLTIMLIQCRSLIFVEQQNQGGDLNSCPEVTLLILKIKIKKKGSGAFQEIIFIIKGFKNWVIFCRMII